MKRAEVACALAVLAAAGLMLRESTRLVIGWGPSGPGAGFFPFWLSVGMAAFAVLILAQTLSGNPSDNAKAPFFPEGAIRSQAKVFLPMLCAILLMEAVGFYVAAAVYLGFSMRFIGRHAWPLVLGASLLFPIAIYLVMERWFLILLPKGYLNVQVPF